MFRLCLRPLQKQHKILRALVPSLQSLFPFFKAENKTPALLILLAEFKDVTIIVFQEKLSAFQTFLRCTLNMGVPQNVNKTILKCSII